MPKESKQIIMQSAKHLFALTGYEGFSMRTLAQNCGLGVSSIYHFFEDKDLLLKYIFDEVSKDLGRKRKHLAQRDEAKDMLYDRIVFQFENIEDVVFVLKYYLHFRKEFERNAQGYIPTKAYLHIEEVLKRGIETGEFNLAPDQVVEQSKIVTHAINGFLLEYYPEAPKGRELQELTQTITQFLVRSLSKREEPPM